MPKANHCNPGILNARFVKANFRIDRDVLNEVIHALSFTQKLSNSSALLGYLACCVRKNQLNLFYCVTMSNSDFSSLSKFGILWNGHTFSKNDMEIRFYATGSSYGRITREVVNVFETHFSYYEVLFKYLDVRYYESFPVRISSGLSVVDRVSLTAQISDIVLSCFLDYKKYLEKAKASFDFETLLAGEVYSMADIVTSQKINKTKFRIYKLHHVWEECLNRPGKDDIYTIYNKTLHFIKYNETIVSDKYLIQFLPSEDFSVRTEVIWGPSTVPGAEEVSYCDELTQKFLSEYKVEEHLSCLNNLV